MNLKTIISTALTGTILAISHTVSAGEYNDQCAMGLALEKHFETDCSINLEISDKTYCFGNKEAKSLFLEDTKGNIEKSIAYYENSKS